MNEVWKDIEGYEGLYKVSNLGNIYSYKSKRKLKLSSQLNEYLTVQLFKNKIGKRLLVHRLVAKTFIQNPDNLPQVNHKDENKQNNNADNLEWCTAKYNMNYGKGAKTRHLKTDYKTISEKMKKSQYSSGNNNATPVIQLDRKGNFIKRYECEADALRELRAKSNHIPEVCKGKMKSFYGYFWKYATRREVM